MNTQTNLRISIPKPCHEDWNKFTPDEKGAFCKVCSKSVHDFTKKSPEQISSILMEEIGAGKKVCGRFNEDQLTPIPQEIPAMDPVSLNFHRMKKFALALFLVFGGLLFNSFKSSAQKMGKIAYVPRHEPVRGELVISREEPKIDTIKNSIPVEPMMLKGDVAVEPLIGQTTVTVVTGGVSIIEEPIREMGEIAIDLDPVTEIQPLIGDTVVSFEPVVEVESVLMGLVAASYDYCGLMYEPQVEEEELLPEDTLQINSLAVPESTFVESNESVDPAEVDKNTGEAIEVAAPALQCYPNPSANGYLTVRYRVKQDGLVSLSVYDLNGSLVKSFIPARQMYASLYETRFDVSELPDGVYFCELIAGANKTTERIIISK